MRFLVDASLSPVMVHRLSDAGHDAVHVGDVLRLDVTDEVILDRAAEDDRVIVAADTDFGELLARRGSESPSVVLLRRQTGRRPVEQAAVVLANLPGIESDLAAGAVVVIEEQRIRVRRLPIHRAGTS